MKIEAFLNKMKVAHKGYFQCKTTKNGTIAHNGYMIIQTEECADVPDTNEFARGTISMIDKIDKEIEKCGKVLNTVPTIKQLKECISNIAGRKSSVKVAYYFGNKILVNARWFKDILEYLGEDVYIEYVNYKVPIRIIGDSATIYLCGMSTANDKMKEGECYKIN